MLNPEIEEVLFRLDSPFNQPRDPSSPAIAMPVLFAFCRSLPVAKRSEVIQEMRAKSSMRLLSTYGITMGAAAVRENSVQRIKDGLLGVVMEGGLSEYRDTICSLALLRHSAEKLGLDPRSVFSEAEAFADDRMHTFVQTILSQDALDISAYGYEEGTADGRFCYKQKRS